jgi:hypothetical protein
VEGVRPERHRGELSLRLLSTLTAIIGVVFVVWQTPAWAADGEGQSGTVTSASATASGGTISVGASNNTWTPPADSPWAQRSQGDPPGQPNPNQPYGCTYHLAPPSTEQLLGTGGQAPGQWVFPICAGPGVIDPMPPIWVTNAQAAAVQVNQAALAQQAVSQLPLDSPSIEMAPPATSEQLVNVSTWLWLNPAAWHQQTATAAAGPVSATATATPVEVVWSMGDGHQVTCAGPGTPYDSSNPNATTDCSYTWTQSSAGQPGGAYQVTATVYWQVAWTATGAPGGGNLGQVPGPAAGVPVRVAESQAVNTASGA